MGKSPSYFIVESSALPEIFLKVAEAKRLLETGEVDKAPYGPMLPQNEREQTSRAKADIKSGKLVVFTGPVKDQQGVERIPAGTVPPDKELLSMDWFVEGVNGTLD